MEGTVTYNLGCPCEVNCLDGCDECDNPVCDCQVSSCDFSIIANDSLDIGVQ